jgi:NAD+ synthase
MSTPIPSNDLKNRLLINTDLVRKILVSFIRDEVTRVGLSRAVIGLSGGIDSALSCMLAIEALGEENVLAVRMPYKTSSPESLADADLIISRRNMPNHVVEITSMVDPLFERFPDTDPKRKGNAMARARMIVLYDQSAAFNGLVVGTGNKTEILLGYSTIFGDAASALNPLGDLYKTQVRQLAAVMGVPKPILDKAPSADLWVGQTDETELGYTYAMVDQLLYLIVDQRYSRDEAVAAGFEATFVDRVLTTIRRNQFKRMPPLIAKLSNRTIGYDFLYLRDWGT